MKIKNSELERIAVKPEQYPESDLPEIALAGRSNVGKSSFINSVLNRVNLARTSGKPGKTRTLNFYNVNGEFRFVDLPGYGYAKVSKTSREEWAGIIDTYLQKRENLVEIFQIIDMRHPPTALDKQMYEYITHMGFTGYVIATKADKISRGKYDKHLSIIKKDLGIKDRNLIIPYSSEKKTNRETVLETIGNIIEE
ncbi:MAG: YihA family ribosome biogenesis GTP-binding protein [Tissierellia bacterium]|nr:YihA family ribosome biogenesis GTP-binding protein [Tissierellia bacterium]